jgi:hypothetical protein
MGRFKMGGWETGEMEIPYHVSMIMLLRWILL